MLGIQKLAISKRSKDILVGVSVIAIAAAGYYTYYKIQKYIQHRILVADLNKRVSSVAEANKAIDNIVVPSAKVSYTKDPEVPLYKQK